MSFYGFVIHYFFSFLSQITMLINNAGVVSGRALLDTPDHLIERSFNVNVLAHFWVIDAIFFMTS